MNQQPDKFFREKLHGYQKPVSPEAWSRISQNLDKKNRTSLWLKVAASVLLLATTGILLYPRLNNDNNENRAAISTDVTPAPADQPKVTHPTPLADATQTETKKAQDRETPQRPKHRKPATNRVHADEPSAEPADETLQLPEVASIDLQPVEPSDEDSQPFVSMEENIAEPSRGLTIVFSAEEVNKKYLQKKDDIDATSSNKSSSTLQKLLDKAYDLKHNQDPLGGLRQKKDEILAMNFKNDKQRTQND